MYDKVNKMPEFYVIHARKINKIPEFYTIIARKIFFPIFFGGGASPTPMHAAAQILNVERT